MAIRGTIELLDAATPDDKLESPWFAKILARRTHDGEGYATAAHFFVTVPILPYKMGLELPDECVYTLGYYRPGDCAPYMIDPLPLSVRAAFFEGCSVVGFGYAFP